MGAAGVSGPLGARHVATRGPDGWRIERVGPGGLDDHPPTAADYAASLPSWPRDDLVEPFLACGGTMAAFERREDGLRKALGVRVIPYRTQPVLVAQPLTADTDRREFAEVYPILARCEGLSRYHWDTPLYRELCVAMGLHPDERRPRYRPRYRGLAGELERWLGDVYTDRAAPFSPRDEAKLAAFDLLDLMRADRLPDPGLLDRLRRRWVRVDPGYVPRFGELERLVESDELLAGETAAGGMPVTAVEFLPSRHGAGYRASIYGFYGAHEPDGWVARDYAGLRGIALEPDADALRERTWLRTVVRRLREQGVLFLTPARAEAYLGSDEAAYWAWREGGPAKRRVRSPSSIERMLWRVLPPDMPLDRELTRRADGV